MGKAVNTMPTDFDKCVNRYNEIIDDAAKITGEKYDYFIKLRINLMKSECHNVSINRDNIDKECLKILDFGCLNAF